MALVSLEDTRSAILAAVPRLPVVQSAIADAVGLVLAADVVTAEPVPPFANTAMDGYALRAVDTAGASVDAPVRLTADLATLRAWCLGEPWLGELGELSEQSQQVAPVVVAAVTAVLARGENAVNLLLSSGTVRLAAHLSVADAMRIGAS